MKILIIEDEARNFNRLKKMLSDFDASFQIEEPLESIADTRKWLSLHRGNAAPDIIFADIRLGDGLSFDALDQMDSSTSLVFTTAYDEYALRAFQYNGLAYLLKPIEEEELQQTLDRIIHLRSKNAGVSDGIQQLLQQMRKDNYQYRERFLVPYKDGFEIVKADDTSFICTTFKDTRIYLPDGKFFSVSISLDEIEHQLNSHSFFRVNRQYIVNIQSVKNLKTYFAGKLRVYLHGYDNVEVMCSRDRASKLKEWLNK